MNFHYFMRGCVAAIGLMIVSCDNQSLQTANNASAQKVDIEQIVDASLSHRDRPQEDRTLDEARKPDEVLAFAGVRPGMIIFEIEAGSGYYTELMSRIVGSEGTIFLQNPEGFDSFLGDAVPIRLANKRLPNVRATKSPFDQLAAADSGVDLVTWMLGPHELYFTPSDGGSLGEVRPTYDEIFRILKPGAAFIVLDHAAVPGSDETTGDTYHRIDPGIVKELAREAGFELSVESDILRNPDDMHDVNVFDPQVRRKTDRFLLKFVKPE